MTDASLDDLPDWDSGGSGDTPTYRKRTLLRMAIAEKAAAYWKTQLHLTDEEWCAKHLKIVNKAGELVPFIFNAAQKILAAEIRLQLKETGTVKLVILKARQLGMSLVVQALMWRIMLERSNMACIVAAHEAKASDKVFARTRIFRDETRPMYPFRYSKRDEIEFEPPHRSKIEVSVATSKGLARSGTYQITHLSEVAFWVEAKKNLTALFGGQADSPNTWVIWESTANGIGGEFYEKYWRTKRANEEARKKGKPILGYRAIFLPWYIDPEYRIPGAKLDDYPADVETLQDEDSLRLAGCVDEHLAYRRKTIDEKYNGDVEMWHQEMPANDREAFIASGRVVFPRSHVSKRVQELENRNRDNKPATYRVELKATEAHPWGYEEWARDHRIGREQRPPVEHPYGELTVYESPRPGRKYLVAADVAKGIEVNNDAGRRGGDYSVAHVYDRATGRQVAVWRGHIDPDLYGCVLHSIGLWYQDTSTGRSALMAPEENSFGLTVIKTLQRLEYDNLYLRERLENSGVANTIVEDRWGWLTTGNSKDYMVSALLRMFRKGLMRIEHLNTVIEMSTYIYTKEGGTEARDGCFDDEVTAAAIAAAIMTLDPVPREALSAPAVVDRSPAYYLMKIQDRQDPTDLRVA